MCENSFEVRCNDGNSQFRDSTDKKVFWIWIRIGFVFRSFLDPDPHPNWAKILDPDPNSMYFDPQYCFSARPRQLTVNQSKNPTTDALVHLKGQSYEKTDSTKATGESIRSQNRNGTDIRLSRRPDIRSNMRLGQVTGNFLLRENVSEQMLAVVYFRLDIPPHPIYGVPVRILVEQKSGRPDIRQNQYQHS